MNIGDRLRQLREHKKMSQGDIEKKTGLLRCYVSRVENNFTVPAVETLEKFASAFGLPLYQIFYDGTNEPKDMIQPNHKTQLSKKDRQYLGILTDVLPKLSERDKSILISTAKHMTTRNK